MIARRWPWRAAAWETRTETAIGQVLRRRRGWRATPVVFPSYGRVRADDAEAGWIRLLGRVLVMPPDADSTTDGRSRGWRRYLTIAEPGLPVAVTVGGQRFDAVTSRGGYLDERLSIDLPAGSHEVQVATSECAGTGTVTVIDPTVTRRGVVSDIDDTVVVTLLPRPMVAFWNTFVLRESARQAVPGMAAFLDSLDDGFVIYLSTGAWNYAPVIRDFLLRAGYPDGSLLMTDWGPSAQRWFRSGVEHKRSALRRLRAEFPELTWTLVGDDGQHDPVVYNEFAAEHPGVVDTIAIRQLSATQHVLSHGTPAAPDESHESHPHAPSSDVHRITGPDGFALLSARNPTSPR